MGWISCLVSSFSLLFILYLVLWGGHYAIGPSLQAFLLLVDDFPLTHHFGFVHYYASFLPCSYFAIGQPLYHMTFSMYIYSSLARESLFLYLCYLRISCPFPVLCDWVDKWLRNSFLSLLSLSLLSLNILLSFSSTLSTKL